MSFTIAHKDTGDNIKNFSMECIFFFMQQPTSLFLTIKYICHIFDRYSNEIILFGERFMNNIY